MKVYFDNEGNFIKATGSSIFKQSSNANELICVLPYATGEDVASVSATFLLPYAKNSGQVGQYAPTSRILTPVNDPDDGMVWRGTLDAGYLNNSGMAFLSARVVFTNDTIKTSQRVQFKIEPSGDYIATAVTQSTAEQLDAKINELFSRKQDRNVPDLGVGDNTIEGAIKYLDYLIKNPDSGLAKDVKDILIKIRDVIEPTLDTHDKAISKNAQDIADLADASISGRTWVGTIEEDYLPTFPYESETTTLLNNFVQEKLGRQPKDGDYLDWKYLTAGGTFRVYTIAYTTKWNKPDLQAPIEKASNERYGVLKGGITANNQLNIDIVAGTIHNISVLIASGEYKALSTYLNEVNAMLEDIVDGTTPVAKATHSTTSDTSSLADKSVKAENDGLGRNIVETYAGKNDVYTKDQADDKFLPNTYSKIYYYSNAGIVDVVPTLETPQFSVTANKIGSTELFTENRTLQGNYKFNKNSSDNSVFWIATDRDCQMSFRLTTTGIVGAERTVLAVDTSEVVSFTANVPNIVNIKSLYNQLGEHEIKLVTGNKIEKKLEIVTDFSTATKVDMYCNETYPSTFILVAQSITLNVNKITGKKVYDIAENDWQDNGEGEYFVDLTAKQLDIAPSTQYGMDMQYWNGYGWQRVAFTPIIRDNGSIKITSAKPIEAKLLVWVATDLDAIKDGGTRVSIAGQFVQTMDIPKPIEDMINDAKTPPIELGSIAVGEFSIDPSKVEAMFDPSPTPISFTWSNYKGNMYRIDMSTDIVYYASHLKLNGIDYIYRITVDRTTNKGVFNRTEEQLADKDTASAMANRLGFNQILDTATSTLPTANGLVVTNIYGGHHVEGTTEKQYYHKMYDVATTTGHWYYFAPNFSNTKSVYILGHIDSTTFSTNKGKVFEGGAKFDAYIQIERDKTMDFDVQPVLIDLTEMFGAGNEPMTEDDAYKFIQSNTYYPFKPIKGIAIDNIIQVGTDANENTPTEALKVGGLFLKMHGWTPPPKMGVYGVDKVGSSNPDLKAFRTDDAVGMTYSLNSDGKTYSSDFDNAYPWGAITEVTDDKGNKFIRIPKFYHKYTTNSDGTLKIQICGEKKDDSWGTCFINNGVEIDYMDIGKYEASGTTSLMASKTNQPCLVNININQARASAMANGSSYHQFDIWNYQVLQLLFLVEFATTNSQSIMQGYTNNNNSAAVKTGRCDALGLKTGSELSNTSGTSACSYRGIENPWGNIYKWVDGINFNSADVYACDDIVNYASGKYSIPYKKIGTRASSKNWLSKMTPAPINYQQLFVPTGAAGSDSTYFCDYYYTGGTVLAVGAGWSAGSDAGLWCWYGGVDSSFATFVIGCRLCRKPIA